MSVEYYLNSGLLERYAAGILAGAERQEVEQALLLFPKLRHELEQILLRLEGFTTQQASDPPAYLKEQVLDLIDNLNLEISPQPVTLPLINRFSSHLNWMELLGSRLADAVSLQKSVTVLQHKPELTQLLLILDEDVEEEMHDDLQESFLILKGHCRCTIGSQTLEMGPGGFMEIPLYQPHRVQMLEPGVTAILQRIPT